MSEQMAGRVRLRGPLSSLLAREEMGSGGREPAGEPPAQLPGWLARTVLLGPGQDDRADGWQRIEDFLAPLCLQRRHRAVVLGLAPMNGGREATQRCAWALTALNVVGWTLAPVLACAVDGLGPVTTWAHALRVRAGESGPVDLGIRVPDVTEDPGPAAGEQCRGEAQLTGAEEFAGVLRDALTGAGAPRVHVTSAIASALNTVAADPLCRGQGCARLTSGMWRSLVPTTLGLGGPPGSEEFCRPSCCGLAELAGDPGSACGDCPSRHAR
ncbi:MAG: hypothetical protein WAX29_07025 [Propionibacterium sp.]